MINTTVGVYISKKDIYISRYNMNDIITNNIIIDYADLDLNALGLIKTNTMNVSFCQELELFERTYIISMIQDWGITHKIINSYISTVNGHIYNSWRHENNSICKLGESCNCLMLDLLQDGLNISIVRIENGFKSLHTRLIISEKYCNDFINIDSLLNVLKESHKDNYEEKIHFINISIKEAIENSFIQNNSLEYGEYIDYVFFCGYFNRIKDISEYISGLFTSKEKIYLLESEQISSVGLLMDEYCCFPFNKDKINYLKEDVFIQQIINNNLISKEIKILSRAIELPCEIITEIDVQNNLFNKLEFKIFKKNTNTNNLTQNLKLDFPFYHSTDRISLHIKAQRLNEEVELIIGVKDIITNSTKVTKILL